MTRFSILVSMGVGLALGLALLGRWLWRQRWRDAGLPRRAAILAGALASVVLLVLLEGGLELLWHERPNQPATVGDLRILERAEALLATEAAWNRRDEKVCEDDDRNRSWSLYCALETACRDVGVSCEHTQVASQEVRFAIEEVTGGRNYAEGRLSGFNNQPETRFEDVRTVLRKARERVAARVRP